MKTMFITGIAAFALAHSAAAHTWTWFRGDIGLASPFVSSSPAKQQVASRAVTKQSPVSNRAKAVAKPKPTDKRITAR
jgi:hypothetical protein